MNTLEIAGIIFGGLTVVGGIIKWITSIITKKNEEIEKKNKVIEGYKNEKLNGINNIEKEFENHVKESGGIKNENFIIMEKKVVALEKEMGNMQGNLNEFKQDTKKALSNLNLKMDRNTKVLNEMAVHIATLSGAVKSLRNGKNG